jgi:hypothetical protein
MSENKNPMTKEDASRIQAAVDRKNTESSDEEFKKRAQRTAEKNSKK